MISQFTLASTDGIPGLSGSLRRSMHRGARPLPSSAAGSGMIFPEKHLKGNEKDAMPAQNGA